MGKEYDYNKINSPYNSLLHRENDLTYQFGSETPLGNSPQSGGNSNGEQMGGDGTMRTRGGAVSTVALKTEGNATDVWIQNYIRSVNWKPKTVGFYINGQTGYAEFANVYVAGVIVVATGAIGGFDIGPDYIRDHLNTMGMASTVTGADDVRFWAGSTFANRYTAPFRVLESGDLYANNAVITGGTIAGGAIVAGSVGYTELTYPPTWGSNDPTTTPDAIGRTYINTAQGRIFMSIGTSSDADWVRLATVAVIRSPSPSDTVSVTDVLTSIRIVQMRPFVFDTVTVTENISLSIV